LKILVSGCRGMLGTDLMRVLASAHEVIGVDLEEVDITDLQAVEEQVAALGDLGETLPADKARELIERLAAEVEDEEKRARFRQVALETLGEIP